MDGKFLKNHWSDLRDRISEWWDDLTDDDLDQINGNQEKLINTLQSRYGYTRNLAFDQVRTRMATYHPNGGRKDKHSRRDVLQYPSYKNSEWFDVTDQDFPIAREKGPVRSFAHQK